jgi:hypothetical protein
LNAGLRRKLVPFLGKLTGLAAEREETHVWPRFGSLGRRRRPWWILCNDATLGMVGERNFSCGASVVAVTSGGRVLIKLALVLVLASLVFSARSGALARIFSSCKCRDTKA